MTAVDGTKRPSAAARELLVTLFPIEQESLVPGARLADDLGLDSIDVIDLITSLNETLGVSLGPEDFQGCDTLGDLETRLDAAAGRPDET